MYRLYFLKFADSFTGEKFLARNYMTICSHLESEVTEVEFEIGKIPILTLPDQE